MLAMTAEQQRCQLRQSRLCKKQVTFSHRGLAAGKWRQPLAFKQPGCLGPQFPGKHANCQYLVPKMKPHTAIATDNIQR